MPADDTGAGGTPAVPMPSAAELLAATEGSASVTRKPARSTTKVPSAGKTAAAEPPGHGGGVASFGAAMGLTESPDARALREAADAEPGVRSRSCLIRTDHDTGTTTVTISIAVAYGLALHAVAEQVRERVAAAAVDVLGIVAPAKRATGKGTKKTAKTAAAAKSPARTAKADAKAGASDGGLRVDVKVVWLDEPPAKS